MIAPLDAARNGKTIDAGARKNSGCTPEENPRLR
jgi:hypothetical protein